MDHDKYIGRLLDNRYEILEVIGVGGMAVVYKARCHRLNRLVAIKILKDDLYQDEEFRRRFHAESQAVAMLSHPNIMSVYDVSTTEAADYIVMELIDGITLKQYMEKKGVLNWKETLHFSMQIAKALEHAHSRGLVHRDIKPHNVMVLKNGSVKVTDFGIARIMSSSNTLTKEALGSVHYISPEQAKGGRVDVRSDLYSLGVVMYEMMTGKPPYDGESPVSVAIQHISGGAPMPSTLNPNIPGGLEQIIMRLMAVDPAKRYPSATALLYDMEEFRKNPSILFDFNNTPVDDAVKLQSGPVVQAKQTPQQPLTAAERAAGKAQQRPRPNQNPQSPTQRTPAAQTQRSAADAQARQRSAARREQEQKRAKMVTIAVAACSAVAVLAIIIFLKMVLSGGLTNSAVTLVKVPNLVGQVYEELDRSLYPDVIITLSEYEYSEEYDKGEIMDQTPRADTQVGKGSEVKVYVSMGPDQGELPKMEDLSGATEDAAREWLNSLNNSLDGDLRILTKEENSDTIKEGRIVRTEPGVGTQLERGQTVTLYLSLGPATVTKDVPDVVGMTKDQAVKTLEASGFTKYKIQEEESRETKGTVIRLNVDPNAELDVKTEIILYVSKGEITATVPYVVGKSYEAAYSALDALGFTNIKKEPRESAEDRDLVLEQSVPSGTQMDVTKEIVLYVSEGVVRQAVPYVLGKSFEEAKKALNDAGFSNVTSMDAESDAPRGQVVGMNVSAGEKYDVKTQIVLSLSTGPKVSKRVIVNLPTDMAEAYTLTIMYQGGTVVETTVQPGTPTYEVTLSGRGEEECEVYINGEYYTTVKVDFNN